MSDDEGESRDDGGRAPPRGGMERRRAHAFTDAELVAAMRADDPWAWGEFVARFQPLLLGFAKRIGVPPFERAELVDEVLTDSALFLTSNRRGAKPDQLGAYLSRALHNKRLERRRAENRREARYAAASSDSADATGSLDGAVAASCSEHTLHLVREPAVEEHDPDAPVVARAIGRLVATLRTSITPDEEQLLGWHGAQVPHRVIASWIAVSYDATTKRIWRLARRVRAQAMLAIAQFPDAEREALLRVFARADEAAAAVHDRQERV